jgi:hypothetical protein
LLFVAILNYNVIFQPNLLIMKSLLFIIEQGFCPQCIPLFKQHHFNVETVTSLRKANKQIKKQPPDVIVAEFHIQPGTRDRISFIESVFSTTEVQNIQPTYILFYQQEHQAHLDRMKQRFTIHHTLAYPINMSSLSDALAN